MHRLLQRIIANPVITLLLVASAAWGGFFALIHLPVGLFPGLDVPVVNVVAHYPGASGEDLEQLVTRPVENRIRAIPGVQRVASTSIAGVAQISVEFTWGTRLTDARQLMQAALSTVQPTLPAEATLRLENIGTTLQEVAGYVVYGGGSLTDLRTAVQLDVVNRLMEVPSVQRVDVIGGDQPAFLVNLHPDAMLREHLSVKQVAGALSDYNQVAPADFIDRGSREYPIRGDSRLQNVHDIEAVPVIGTGTNSVFIRDIATVQAGSVPRHYQIHGDGRPAVAFIVFKQPDANTIRVVHGVDRKLDEIQTLLPSGAQVRKYYDQSDIVTEARDSLFHDLIIGAVLAAAVLYFFMGTFRATLIVAATIPITLLAALALMQAFGQTLNVITLSALTLAVGMVVDDAIVVAESIVRHLHAGIDRQTASLTGAEEIAGPDASGTFTTVAVFAPLLFMGGIVGLFIRPFGLVVTAALLASLVASLTFVPMMFGWKGAIGRRTAVGSRLLDRLNRRLQRMLHFTFGHKWISLGLSVLLLGLGGLAAWLGPIHVLPPIDEGALLIEYVMPPGTSLKESDRIGDILEQQALANPDVTTVYRRTGSPQMGYQIEGVDRGEMTIKLKPRNVRKHTLDQIMESLRRRYSTIPGMAVLYHQPTQEKMDESLSGLPAMFGVTLFGPDMNKLIELADEAEGMMAHDAALANLVNNTKIKSPQIIVKPNPVVLAQYGLSPRDVFASIQAARFGVPATTFVRGQQPVQVIVKTAGSSTDTVDGLKQLTLPTPYGQSVPLQQVADVHISHLPSAVTRLNGQREVTILAEVNGSIPATVKRLREAFSAISLPDGYSIAFTGQYQVMRQSIRDFALIGLAAVMLIYLIMALQFRSWRQPLLILTTIPVALVGAIVLLAITRVGLDISVGMGVLTLLGISVNNAIVLLDYANRQIRDGHSTAEALANAVSVRLRPILMTALTTIFALLPVALNPAVGSRIFQPFAVTVIGGLVTGTLATLLLVPTLAYRRSRAGLND